MKWLLAMLCGVLVAAWGWAATPSTALTSEPVSPTVRAAELKVELQSLLEARDAALAEIRERYRTVAPEERTALEAEGARLANDYERAYLVMVMEYHRLTGNAVEQARAERMLEAMDTPQASVTTRPPVAQDLPSPTAPVNPVAKEGVQTDAR